MFNGNGLIIDKEKNRYKKYVSVLFFEVGDWKPLPKISFIALTLVGGTHRMHSRGGRGASVTLKVDLYCVYMCLDQKRKILVKKSKKKQEALNLASGAAKYLEIPLNNYLKED
jgi:hypothetical protein